MSIGVGRVTRFSIDGHIWMPAGSFAGKSPGPVPAEIYCEVVSLIDAGDEVLLCTIDVDDVVLDSEMDAFIEVTCEMGGDEVIVSEFDDSDVVIVSEIDC